MQQVHIGNALHYGVMLPPIVLICRHWFALSTMVQPDWSRHYSGMQITRPFPPPYPSKRPTDLRLRILRSMITEEGSIYISPCHT